jgi:hypothetical protein
MFRATIFAGVMLAFWTLGRPAHAATLAPFCDDRGATALAPQPALEATDEAVRRAADAPCDTDAPIFGLALGPAHRILSEVPADAAPAAIESPAQLAPAPLDGSFAPVARETPPQAGVRYRVERPPRA